MSIRKRINVPVEIWTTIRFPQVDAARIIFYPRIFELLSQYFPDRPLAVTPHAFSLDFLKPNRLGDELKIVFEQHESTSTWSFSGRVNGTDHFVMRSLDTTDADLSLDAHYSETASFKTGDDQVGDWMSDRSGVMHLSRYFEQVCIAVEEWFENTLDCPFYQNFARREIGIPTVRFTTRCRELPLVGDTVSVWIRPQRLSNSSMTFKSWLVRDDECLVESEQVVVFVGMLKDGFKPISIPDDIRRAFTARLET